MRIIIIALLLIFVTLSGCVVNTDYTGTYAKGTETLTLFDDGTFSIHTDVIGYSGVYEIMDDMIYLKHPLMSMSFSTNETGIYNDDVGFYKKQ
jgi:hypothetical protein